MDPFSASTSNGVVFFWKSQHYDFNTTVLIFCYYIWNVQAHHMTNATTL